MIFDTHVLHMYCKYKSNFFSSDCKHTGLNQAYFTRSLIISTFFASLPGVNFIRKKARVCGSIASLLYAVFLYRAYGHWTLSLHIYIMNSCYHPDGVKHTALEALIEDYFNNGNDETTDDSSSNESDNEGYYNCAIKPHPIV